MTEGRGPMVPDSYFLTKNDAIYHANLFSGVMGRQPPNGWENSDMGDVQVKPIIVYETADEADTQHQENAKKAALNKLTIYEKQLLGLDNP